MGGQITAIEGQQRNKERVNIYIDGEYAFSLNRLEAFSLRSGQTLSEAEISALKAADAKAIAMDKALHFLGPRPRSVAEIRRHLETKKGLTAEAIEAAITRLAELNYVDDLAFARYWVQNREDFNPRGLQALRYELRQKGIEDALIEEALSDLDQNAAALRAAQKKLRSLRGQDYLSTRRKLHDFLLRRGFSYDSVRAALDEVLQTLKTETDDDDFTLDDDL